MRPQEILGNVCHCHKESAVVRGNQQLKYTDMGAFNFSKCQDISLNHVRSEFAGFKLMMSTLMTLQITMDFCFDMLASKYA